MALHATEHFNYNLDLIQSESDSVLVPIAIQAFMHSSLKPNIFDIARRVLLVAICISIAFGSSARNVLPGLLPSQLLSSRFELLAETPGQPTPVPEESPTEFPKSSDISEESETACFALPRKSQKKSLSRSARHSGHVLLLVLTPAKIHLPMVAIKCRYCDRCGANLRC